jgi:hypothetical protein
MEEPALALFKTILVRYYWISLKALLEAVAAHSMFLQTIDKTIKHQWLPIVVMILIWLSKHIWNSRLEVSKICR